MEKVQRMNIWKTLPKFYLTTTLKAEQAEVGQSFSSTATLNNGGQGRQVGVSKVKTFNSQSTQ